ncbi:hypothetical protein B0T20DRAFT_481725 [Sordaria brevicollis]|uniref:Protein kinase domain-containing protein n=1 Tax=Sordaria brevicollis TaxID=83679 RepID=A0AAE0U8Y9_SORBR|nr:hypothetical protein B0T20DRAFT_481725 [Sordaria brevicollis]
MRQVCNGLGLLHQEGLAHGDLQLRHIIIDRLPQSNSLGQHRSWRVKIGGRRLHYPANPTENESAEEFINAIAYNNLSFLPPEILSCYTLGRPLAFQTPLDIQSIDVWAAGEVAAQLLTGKPIFGLKTQKIMYYQEGTAHFPAWKLDVAMVSALGKRFIATFMHQDPLMRPTLPLDPRNEIAQWVEPANCWDAEQLKRIPLATLYHAKILPPTMHYTPDGSKLVVIDPQTITIRTSFAGFTSTWIYENDKHAAYRASALSSCGKRLAVYDANSNAIKLLDVTQIRNNETPVSYAVSERLFTHSQVVEWQQPLMILKFHPSDSTLLSASSNTFATLNLSVPANPASPVSYQPLEGTRRDPIINTCYTTNGLVLIICYENFTTYTWLQNGEVLFELEHPVPARVMAISPEGERLILGSYNGTIWSISLPLNPPRSEATYWVPVWRAVDRYPIDSIDIAPPSHEGATSAGVVTVAVVSGEKLTLLRIGDDQDDCCLGWVEYKKRKALLAKIKPRVEGESHLEIALWSGGESRITFLKFDKYFEKYEAYEASDEDDEDEDDEDTEEDDEGYDEDADSEEDSEEDSEKDDTYEEEDNEGQEGGFGGLGRKIRLVDGYRDVPPSHF